MWSYYGSKLLLSKHYPLPVFDEIIEPFAGSAKYSLLHFERKITLIDKSPKIISIWNYLKQASELDIKKLPNLPAYSKIKESDFDTDGEFNLMSFLIVQAAFSGNRTVSKWGALRFEVNIKNILKNLHKIKHWEFICDDYINIENKKCTWFIDAPYYKGGHKYTFSNRKINYKLLGEWCNNLKGQKIICENSAATWMDFTPLAYNNGVKKKTLEVVHHSFN